MIEPGSHPICDFCSDHNPVRVYAAADFTFQKESALPQVSEGAWSACQACAEMIDAENWPALTERALAALYKKFPSRHERFLLRVVVEQLHDNFRRHRRADA